MLFKWLQCLGSNTLRRAKKLTLAQKMKLYDGQSVEGFKEQDIKEIERILSEKDFMVYLHAPW